jgi:hypothetical protein
MKPVQHQTDAELAYVIADCLSAIAAMPGGYNVDRYLAECRACQDEQNRRARVRIWRKQLTSVSERLARPALISGTVLGTVYRARLAASLYAYDQWRTAAYCLAWAKLYGLYS